MVGPFARDFSNPDQVLELNRMWMGTVGIGASTASYTIFQPGWRWSTDARPPGSGALCQVQHVGYVIAGVLHVMLADGTEFEVLAGSAFDFPPGHDSWVTSEIPCEIVTWVGARGFMAALAPSAGVLATVLFSDVVDSSGEVRRRGDSRWVDVNTAFGDRTSDLVATFGGQVVKFTGDGVLALFNGVGRAVRCALDLVGAAPHLGLAIRVGVHTGEVETAGGDVHGLAVHEAARTMAAAGSGEVFVSEVTRGLVGHNGLVFEDRGVRDLRGIGARRLFAVRFDKSAV